MGRGLPALGLLVLAACSEDSPPPAGPAPATPPNVVFISIDGLRADHTSREGYRHDTTPTLTALAARGVTFRRAFSQANESLLSHAALFTGRYTSEVAWPEFLEFEVPDDATTLAEVMTAMGYETAAFVGGGHIRGKFGFEQGFGTYFESEKSFGSFHDSVPVALDWLDADRSVQPPFFLFLHGYDTHRPYLQKGIFAHPFSDGTPPDRAFEALIRVHGFTDHVYQGAVHADLELETVYHASGTDLLPATVYERVAAHAAGPHEPGTTYALSEWDLRHVVEHYDSGVLAADTYVGLFLEGLYEAGLWEDTLVVITSDHGEDLQDHGYYNPRPVLYDSTTRVPMLLAGGAVPAAWRGREAPWTAQAIDLVPTLTDLLDTVPPAGTRGRSLWALLEQDTWPTEPDDTRVFQEGVLGQSSVRTDRWRLVFDGDRLTRPDYVDLLREAPLAGGRFSLFEVTRDPTEQADVLGAHLELAEGLRKELAAWRAGLDLGTARLVLDEETLQELRERGYWK